MSISPFRKGAVNRRSQTRVEARVIASDPGAEVISLGFCSKDDVERAATRLHRREATLTEVLFADGKLTNMQTAIAEAGTVGACLIDPLKDPPDPRLIDRFGAADALKHRVLPWRKQGAVTVIIVSDSASFFRHRAECEVLFGPVQMAFASSRQIAFACLKARRTALIRRAEARVAARESCRTIWQGKDRYIGIMVLIGLIGIAAAFPRETFNLASIWAITTLAATVALRAMAAIAIFRTRKHQIGARSNAIRGLRPPRLPKISLLVPLLRESNVAERLMKRLDRLDYPRELLDICLIVEADDRKTQSALAACDLPPWTRVITVPEGPIKTKPRALNYALDFARGSIIGVYDAEDAPEPDQLNQVVHCFQESPPDVACLQGILDFYNPRQNWLARCFTVDYAAWFRIILPGYERLGLAVPLGGTTLFFRRDALEELGGWDAHNVTEDADLGIRLARHGYRTRLIATETHEEANCHLWPWIRQRARWLKGYAMTYHVHMRAPLRLLSDLGPWRFLGMQIIFLGTLSQFLLAPLLWTFWLVLFGLPHPFASQIPWPMMISLASLFLACEVINITIGIAACSGPRHRWLIPWVPSLHFYWPLGAIASWKALLEMIIKPFFWDKTHHGIEKPGRTVK